jgi:DNA-binding MarR family transcriptional regulator
MTTPPAVYGQFGQALGFAERTLTDMLRAHLSRRGTRPETWYALQLIATRGPRRSRDVLIQLLEGSRSVDTSDVPELLARLEARGLISGDAELDLTDEGVALHRSLREYIIGPTIALLSQFDVQDIETTVRTLQAITDRAAEQAASPAGDRDEVDQESRSAGTERT